MSAPWYCYLDSGYKSGTWGAEIFSACNPTPPPFAPPRVPYDPHTGRTTTDYTPGSSSTSIDLDPATTDSTADTQNRIREFFRDLPNDPFAGGPNIEFLKNVPGFGVPSWVWYAGLGLVAFALISSTQRKRS